MIYFILISSISILVTTVQLAKASSEVITQTLDYYKTSDISWEDHQNRQLLDSSYNLYVCRDHFPSDGPAYSEISQATDLFTNVPDLNISVEITRTSHKTKAEVFASSPNHSYFEYIDNEEEGTFPCHNDGSIACADNDEEEINGWTMNTCSYSSSGWNTGNDATISTISVNTHCYGHSSDESSTDYPGFENIAHEIGHSFGMRHSPSWPNSPQFISTMQGNLSYLSAYDIAFLAHFYGTTGTELNTPDLLASSYIRDVDEDSSEGYSNQKFEDVNPGYFYWNSGYLKDCIADNFPELKAMWLNLGNKNITSSKLVSKFIISKKSTSTSETSTISPIKTLSKSVPSIKAKLDELSNTPALSQGTINAQVKFAAPESTLFRGSSTSPSTEYDTLSFEVDPNNKIVERDENNNVIEKTIHVYSDRNSCLNAWATSMGTSESFRCKPTQFSVHDKKRAHIRCSNDYNGITYFAVDLNSNNKEQIFQVLKYGYIKGKEILIRFNPSDTSGSTLGCKIENCRMITSTEGDE